MINIQLHGVKAVRWEKDEDPLRPRILHIDTVDGPHAISLFPVRPEKPAEKGGPKPPVGPPIGGGAPAAGRVESYEEPLRVAA